MNTHITSRLKTLLQKPLIFLRIMEDPKKAHERKYKQMLEWASAPVPEAEAHYAIIQPKGSYPYKVQYKPGITKIADVYEIKAYARSKEEAEKKELVFCKLWLDAKPTIPE